MDINYKNLIMNSPNGYTNHKIIFNEKGHPIDHTFMEVNPVFEKLIGLKSSKIIGKSISDVFPQIMKDDIDWIKEYAKIPLNGKEKEYVAFSDVLNKQYIVKVYSPEKNCIVSIFFETANLDKTKNKESLLKQNYKKLFNNLTSGCAIYKVINNGESGKDYIIEDFNKKSLEIERLKKEDVIGKSLFDLRPKIDDYGLIDIFRKVWVTGKSSDFSSKFYSDEKYDNYYENQVFKLDDEHIVALYNDVTIFMENQKKLEEANDLLQTYMKTSPYGIFISDKKGSFTYVNEKAVEMTGYSKEELLNINLTDITSIKNTKEALDSFNKLIENGAIGTDKNYILKNGDIRTWHVKAVKINEDNFLGYVQDITEIKNSQLLLEASEAQFREMIESNSAIILLIDPKTAKIEHANPAACRFYGWSSKEMLNKTKYDMNTLPKNEVNKIIKQVVSQKNNSFELEHKTRSGDIKNVKVDSTCIIIQNRPLLLSIIHDVTARIKAENDLKKREALYRLLFQAAPLSYQSLDYNGNIIQVNKAWLDMIGYTKKEVMGRWFGDFLAPNSVENFKARFTLFMSEGSTYNVFDLKKKNGDIITVGLNGTVVYEKDKTFIQTHCILEDITKKLENENKLKESEERLRLSHEIAKSGTWELKSGSDKIWISEQIFKIFGLNSESGLFSIESIERRIHENDREMVHNALLDFLEYKNKYDIVYRIKPRSYKENEYFYVRAIAERQRDNQGNVTKIIGVVIDITEQKKLEKNRLLLESQIRNNQKLESIGTLARGVAHEINNPINGILNYAQIIFDLTKDSSDINKFAYEIIAETTRVSAIVKDLFDFSREAGKEHSYAQIKDIIEKTLSFTKTIFRHDDIDVIVTIEKNISKIKCRSQQIQQVLMNLLNNSKDALNEKYPAFNENKKITIDCIEILKDDRKWISVTVKDLGIGIPEKIIDKIFDPFFTTKKEERSPGLGLSISYGIIKEHHGELRVDSLEDEYTEFTMALPCDNGWDKNKN